MDVGYPLVNSILQGYNGTIFAYGQTGCGKTFTMEGLLYPPEMRGIIPSCFSQIFAAIGNDKSRRFLVFASYIEIYNEEVRDLLGDDPKWRLEVKENSEKQVFVQGLTKNVVTSVEEIDALQKKGNKNRSVGFTKMNADSSRSHSIFTITIEATETNLTTGEEHFRAGKLNLVDLAGSERQSKTAAEGLRLKEATKINLSLSALGNVISALTSSNKVKHIPYRDSKLTRLLQDSLGGNTRTVMLAAISPSEDAYDETLTTLRYANRAKNIKNKPVINEDPKDAMLRQYQEEINRLRAMLEEQASTTAPSIAKAPQTLDQLEIRKLESDEVLQLKKEMLAQHEEKTRLLEMERAKALELQRRLQEEWNFVQSERNSMAVASEAVPDESDELVSAQQELEMAMDQNAVRSAALDFELQDMRDVIEAEHTMTANEFTAILVAKEAEVRDTQKKQISLEQEKIATKADKARLQQMLALLESQVIAGGHQSTGEKLEHERQMMEAQERLLQEQHRRDELAIQHKKAEEDRLMLQEHFSTLQEEVTASRQKLQALQTKYSSALTEIQDLQAEYEYEREETLESIRQFSRNLDLYKLILSCLVEQTTIKKVVASATWDDENEHWNISQYSLRLLRNPGLAASRSVELNDENQGPAESVSRLTPKASSPSITPDMKSDEKFAELRKLVNDQYSSSKRPLSKPQQSVPSPSVRPAPVSVAPISKWDRSKSVLNEIRPIDHTNSDSTAVTDLFEEIFRKLPAGQRDKFIVSKKIIAVDSTTKSTPNLVFKETPVKPRFNPEKKPAAPESSRKLDSDIMMIWNRPGLTKPRFQAASIHDDKSDVVDAEETSIKMLVAPATERVGIPIRRSEKARALPASLLNPSPAHRKSQLQNK